jgi:hypothetical protein
LVKNYTAYSSDNKLTIINGEEVRIWMEMAMTNSKYPGTMAQGKIMLRQMSQKQDRRRELE